MVDRVTIKRADFYRLVECVKAHSDRVEQCDSLHDAHLAVSGLIDVRFSQDHLSEACDLAGVKWKRRKAVAVVKNDLETIAKAILCMERGDRVPDEVHSEVQRIADGR